MGIYKGELLQEKIKTFSFVLQQKPGIDFIDSNLPVINEIITRLLTIFFNERGCEISSCLCN